jgi:hypothetical protein
MLLELRQRSPQRSFPEQDELGQALLFDRSHPAFRKSIPVWAARRESQTFHTPCRQGLPEFSAELGIAILQHLATAVQISHLLQRRIARYLAHPARIRMIADSRDRHPPAIQVNEK